MNRKDMKILFAVATLSLTMVVPAFGQAWWTFPEGSPERAAAQQAARQEANIAAQRAAEAQAKLRQMGGGGFYGISGDRIELPGVPNLTPPSEKTFTCAEIAATGVEMDRKKYGVASKADEYRDYRWCEANKSSLKGIK